MKLENQVCSLELAKELKELGVGQDSIWIWIDWEKNRRNLPSDYGVYLTKLAEENSFYADRRIASAFTVAELGEMLGRWGKPWLCNDEWIVDIRGGASGEVIKHTIKASTEANARAKMLIYLIKEGLVKA